MYHAVREQTKTAAKAGRFESRLVPVQRQRAFVKSCCGDADGVLIRTAALALPKPSIVAPDRRRRASSRYLPLPSTPCDLVRSQVFRRIVVSPANSYGELSVATMLKLFRLILLPVEDTCDCSRSALAQSIGFLLLRS
jgi:hypothetical protein